jgi:glucosylceramidase
MHILRSPITSACLVLLMTACSSGSGGPGGNGGVSDTGGTSENPSGGSSGNSTGGTSGNPEGGTSGTTGGTTGNPTGGTSGNPAGGTTGSPQGGTSGNPAGGSGGSPAGGATGRGGSSGNGGASGRGGASGNPTGGTPGRGGSSGNPTGGSSAGSGGAVGSGGSGAGGAEGTGGSGTGGTTPPANTLVTSANNAFWKSATWTESTSNATVTVDDTKTSQTWQGFGGAFNEKGWGYLTSDSMKTQAIQALFGKDGCNFAWGRIPIGSSDYADSRYSLNENAGDNEMTKFSIDRDKQKLIPYIKAAQAVKSDIRFWASPWSPPTWMKTGPYNPNTGASHSNFDGGVMKSDDATLKALALYLVKFVQAYADQGINVEIVSPQNEPNYQQNYPSCHWETSTFVNFVGKYFGPAITSANLKIKIMDGTLSNPSGDADIGQSVLRDSSAKSYIGSIGVQWGMGEANQVNSLKSLAGDIPIWISETKCDGNINSGGPAPNDFNYANSTWGYIKGAIGNGLTAYNAWNMVLDKNGQGIDDTRKWAQNTLIVADSGNLTMTPAYYVYRHFSQFVDPGATVIGTSGGDAVAFKNPDGSLVAVLHSTSANSNYVVSIGGKKLQFAMPSGWATIKYKP